MTYAELTRKYILKEISREEYERGKEDIIYKLFDLYEECILDEETLREKIKLLRR